KTTLLKCMAGLLAPSQGAVVFENKLVTEPPPKMAVVFQDYSRSLLPWLSVAANVELLLRNKLSKPDRRTTVERVLQSVGRTGKGALYPWQMSGGMQQRAAIARGLAYQPDVLLMDEPFAAVDAQTRIELEDLVLKMNRDLNMTVLFVTHDIDEVTVKPQVFINTVPDHVIIHRMFPQSESRTIVICDWLFLPEVIEQGMDISKSVE